MMKKSILILTLSFMLAGNLLCAFEIMNRKNMRLEFGKAIPHVNSKPFFEVDFGKLSDGWDLKSRKNYQNKLTIAPSGNFFGEKCFLVYRTRKGSKDTSWGITSKPFKCNVPAGPVIISVKAATSVDMERVYYGAVPSEIEWRDVNGKAISRSMFHYNNFSKNFAISQTSGIVPRGTRSFVIRLGFGTPDIEEGDYFAVKSVALISTAKKISYVKSYSYETSILAAEDGKISWKSSTPAGTAIRIAACSSPHNRNKSGYPVKWGKWSKEYDKAFTVKEPWVKLRITHYTANGKYPELKELNVGGRKVTHFQLLREPSAAPLVRNLSSVGPTENTRCDVVLRITCPTPIHWGSLRVSIDKKDVTADLVRKCDTVTYKTPVPYAPGRHIIRVSVSNIKGISSNNTKYLIIGKHRSPNTPRTSLRDDGVTLIDGKPFFPIGIFGVGKCFFNNNDFEKCMQDLKKTGFNLIHTYGRINCPEGDAYVAAAQKYGFKLWFEGRDPFKRQLLQKHIKNPAIISWYHGDDTSDYTYPARFQDLYDASKAVDGSRLTCQADGTGFIKKISQYRDFVLGSDIFMPEIYPCQRQTDFDRDKSVAQIIYEMGLCRYDIAVSGTVRPRALWPIIQFFYSTVGNNPKRGWLRFPDKVELRAMSYASIIHGGQGIIWYAYGKNAFKGQVLGAYGANSTPERWKIMSDLTLEFKQLSPILLSRTPKQQPPVPQVISGPCQDYYGAPSITCLLKKYNGKTYIFAVNSVRQKVTAQFRLPGMKQGKILFENRSVTVKNGILTDTFKPYAVHIYEF